jgi:hypothetical protein
MIYQHLLVAIVKVSLRIYGILEKRYSYDIILCYTSTSIPAIVVRSARKRQRRLKASWLLLRAIHYV